MNNRYPIFAAMLGLAIAQLPGIASAAASWTFNSGNCVSTSPSGNCGSGDNNFADTRTYGGSNGAGNVTVSGWANTQSGNKKLERGETTHYGGGLGVRNADWNSNNNPDAGENYSPEHAVDNNGRFDLVLFDFGTQSVDLSQVALGWYSNDSDLTVLAYTGNSDPTDQNSADYIRDREAWWNSSTDNNEDLTSNGWTAIGNHDVDNGPGGLSSAQNVNPGGVASSYWIVAAYNPVFGSSCSPNNYCQTNPADYFKISALTGDIVGPPTGQQSVPAPATLALIVLGLAGIGYKQRVKKKAA